MVRILFCLMNLMLFLPTQCLDQRAIADEDGNLLDLLNEPGILSDLAIILQNDKTGLPSTELSDAAFDAAVAKPKTFRLSETNGLFALTNAPQGETDGKGLSLVDILKKRPGENEALEEIPRGFSPSRGKRHHYRDVPYVNWIVNHLLTLRKNMSNSYQRNRFNFGNSRGPKRSKFAPPRGFSISRGK